MTVLAEHIETLKHASPLRLWGRVVEVCGLVVRVADLPVPVGALVRIASKSRNVEIDTTSPVEPGHGRADDRGILAEVVGFDHDQTIVMPMGTTEGISRGDRVLTEHFGQQVRVGESLLGRVLDAVGHPIDGRGPLEGGVLRSLHPTPIDPLDRPLIDQPLATGVRAIDALVSIGRGQRLGVFAAPGVGKSVLLGIMARHTAADVTVMALVGERGREVIDFLKNQLGEEGLARSIVVCATSDEPALMRLRAALTATTIAEHFRDQGRDVLLIMDSLTRYCHAQRQIGLAAGEPPSTKGYPPSVFASVPKLLERCGRTKRGSITGLYAVLVEGDDLDDPVADAARGVLDGHVVLSRELARRGHWPAIDLLESVSRLVDDVTETDQIVARQQVLKLVHAYRSVEDLLNIGAYTTGSNEEFDLAIACKSHIDRLVQQGRREAIGTASFERTRMQLMALWQSIQTDSERIGTRTGRVPQGPAAQPGVMAGR